MKKQKTLFGCQGLQNTLSLHSYSGVRKQRSAVWMKRESGANPGQARCCDAFVCASPYLQATESQYDSGRRQTQG